MTGYYTSVTWYLEEGKGGGSVGTRPPSLVVPGEAGGEEGGAVRRWSL